MIGRKCNITVTEFKNRTPSNLWNNRYEVRVDGDERPWYYENKDSTVKNGKYVITVVEPDGKTNVFHDARDFKKHYRLWNCGGSVELFKNELMRREPEFKITIDGDVSAKPIQVKNIDTNTVYIFESIRDASRELNITFSTIHSSVKRNDLRIYKGFIFRYLTDEPWGEPLINKYVSQRIKLTHCKNGKVKYMKSLKEAARFFNCDRSKIKRHVQDKETLKGWLMEFL